MTQSTARTFCGIAVLLGAASAAAILPRSALSGAARAREIRLVVRDMTYYAEGGASPNPTLLVRRGERVRVILRNEDPGMTHDFTIPGWGAASRQVVSRGETAVEFRAPAQAGEQMYVCTPHGQMMRGTIRAE